VRDRLEPRLELVLNRFDDHVVGPMLMPDQHAHVLEPPGALVHSDYVVHEIAGLQNSRVAVPSPWYLGEDLDLVVGDGTEAAPTTTLSVVLLYLLRRMAFYQKFARAFWHEMRQECQATKDLVMVTKEQIEQVVVFVRVGVVQLIGVKPFSVRPYRSRTYEHCTVQRFFYTKLPITSVNFDYCTPLTVYKDYPP